MGVGSSGLGLVWNYRGGALLGPGRAAGFLYLVPLFAVTGSVLLLGESVYPRQLLGGAFIVLGVLLAQRRPDGNSPLPVGGKPQRAENKTTRKSAPANVRSYGLGRTGTKGV